MEMLGGDFAASSMFSFLVSANVFYLRVIEGWTIHTKKFPQTTKTEIGKCHF